MILIWLRHTGRGHLQDVILVFVSECFNFVWALLVHDDLLIGELFELLELQASGLEVVRGVLVLIIVSNVHRAGHMVDLSVLRDVILVIILQLTLRIIKSF